MYQVPPSQRPSAGFKESNDGRCPTCGSRSYLPGDGLMMDGRNLPRALQRFICADCGTRYRIIEALPTWRDLAHEGTTYVVLILLLAVGLALLL